MVEDVTDYGAVGDGSTDDTKAIRQAATAAGPGGTVYFPAGTYLVGSTDAYPLDYPMDGSWDELTWRGESHDSATLLMDGGQDTWHKRIGRPRDLAEPGLRADHPDREHAVSGQCWR